MRMATICFSLYILNSHRYLLRTLDYTLAKQASELLAIATTITTRYDTVINEPQKAGINIFDEIRAATFSLSHSFHCYIAAAMYIHWRLLEVFVFVFPICFFATHIEWWGSRVERSTLAMMNDKREIKERWVKNQVEKIRIRQRDCDKFNDAPITQTLEHYLTSLNSFSLSLTTYYTYTYPFWYKHCLSFFFFEISFYN